MSKEEIKQVQIDEIDNQETEELDEVDYTYKEAFNQLALEDEIKRTELQNNPTSEPSEEIKESKLYKEILSKSYALGESMQILLGYGIDYTNAVQIALTLVNNKDTYELQKVQAVQTNNTQI